MTVTVAVHWSVLPLLSVTVKVTEFPPTSEQVKSVTSNTILAIPHTSLLPLLMSAAAIVTLPVASRYASISWQTATGEIVSMTVTVAWHWSVLPLLSVTVRVTVLVPTSEQVKSVTSRTMLAIPHASLLPLFTLAGAIVTLPVASR